MQSPGAESDMNESQEESKNSSTMPPRVKALNIPAQVKRDEFLNGVIRAMPVTRETQESYALWKGLAKPKGHVNCMPLPLLFPAHFEFPSLQTRAECKIKPSGLCLLRLPICLIPPLLLTPNALQSLKPTTGQDKHR